MIACVEMLCLSQKDLNVSPAKTSTEVVRVRCFGPVCPYLPTEARRGWGWVVVYVL